MALKLSAPRKISVVDQFVCIPTPPHQHCPAAVSIGNHCLQEIDQLCGTIFVSKQEVLDTVFKGFHLSVHVLSLPTSHGIDFCESGKTNPLAALLQNIHICAKGFDLYLSQHPIAKSRDQEGPNDNGKQDATRVNLRHLLTFVAWGVPSLMCFPLENMQVSTRVTLAFVKLLLSRFARTPSVQAPAHQCWTHTRSLVIIAMNHQQDIGPIELAAVVTRNFGTQCGSWDTHGRRTIPHRSKVTTHSIPPSAELIKTSWSKLNQLIQQSRLLGRKGHKLVTVGKPTNSELNQYLERIYEDTNHNSKLEEDNGDASLCPRCDKPLPLHHFQKTSKSH